ncbi:MAG: glycosyltransferase [Erysipelotrichia bacterium]|nr:glycosyltransferase [Erysipelotrichia bacterium]
MKVLVTTHAQMFRTPDGKVWTDSVYGYNFFNRYLQVFDEVRVVTRMKDIEFSDMGKKIRVDGDRLEFYSLPFYHGPWEYASKLIKIQKSLLSAIDGCDCAILRIPDQVAFQLFNKIKKEKVPCVVEVVAHSWDLYAPGTINTILRPFLRILWDFLQKKVCSTADGVAYVTEKYIQRRYPSNIKKNDKRFETFYTSADLNNAFFYQPRTKASYDKNVINLVHVSGINNSAKGHYELLKAISIIDEGKKKYKLTFVGGGTMLNYYRDLSEKLGLSKKVKFVGHVSKSQDIASILKCADIFVLPTMTEGLPRVILEAMATGLPCIASDVGGIPELLSEQCLIKANSISSLVSKITYMGNNVDLLIAESNKNFQKAAREFSPDVVQSKRNDFYKKLKTKATK